MASYPIIANCNFESRDDERGITIHAARKAVEAGLTDDAELVRALDNLEETLSEFAERDDVEAVSLCRRAERDVEAAWTVSVQEEAEAAQIARYRD